MKFPQILSLLAALAMNTCWAGDWPQFRGPDGQGHAEGDSLPLHWGESENIEWRAAIHGRAWSSPVVMDGQIWLTTASEDGQQLYAICVDYKTGKIIHDIKLFDVPNPQFAHKFNTYGSPTPAIESGRVYVTFGSPGTACLDTKTGQKIWERRDFVCNHFRGAGSSPVIWKDKLLMHFDGSDKQYVVALNKKTGETAWLTNRSIDHKDILPNGKVEADGDMRKAFSTPLVADFGNGPVMLSLGSKAFYGYDPENGKEIWRIENRKCHSGTCRPVLSDGLIFSCMGFSKGDLVAIKPGGEGDATETNIAWHSSRNVPNKPSPVVANGMLFMVDDNGVASCLDPKTGDEFWRERIGGNYSASPIAGAGKVYFFNEEGKSVVIAAEKEFKPLATNSLGDGFMASPAAVDKSLILRSRSELFKISEEKRQAGK